MNALGVGSCLFCCLVMGCQKASTNVSGNVSGEDRAENVSPERLPISGRAESARTPSVPAKVHPSPRGPLTLDEAVTLASAPTVSERERLEGLQAVYKLKASERAEGMRRLAETGAGEVAAQASAELIRAGVPDAVSVVRRRLPEWSASEQRLVLGAVREATQNSDPTNAALREVPRQVLTNLLEGKFTSKEEKGTANLVSLIDVCAVILASHAAPADKQLLQRTVQRFPQCVLLWQVLDHLGAITDQEESIAKKTYQDEKQPLLVRTAAAAAISGRDAQGAGFAEKQIRDFLSRYGNRFSREEIIALYTRSRTDPGDPSFQEMILSHRDQGLVVMLSFLKTPAAESLTFEAYQGKNLGIQKSAAAVGACRWPERFLAGGQGNLSRNDYVNLLALMTIKQPRLRDEVLKKISKKELEEAQAHLRKPADAPAGTSYLIFLFS